MHKRLERQRVQPWRVTSSRLRTNVIEATRTKIAERNPRQKPLSEKRNEVLFRWFRFVVNRGVITLLFRCYFTSHKKRIINSFQQT